jgi:hypothetical protein
MKNTMNPKNVLGTDLTVEDFQKAHDTLQNQAVNYDSGKLRLDLIPPEVTVALALAFGYGAEKYSDDNWLKGMDWSRHIGSLERHLLDWKMGQTHDKESGNHHLAHALVRMAMLLVYEMREIGNDDRKKCYKDSEHLVDSLTTPVYKELNTQSLSETLKEYLSSELDLFNPVDDKL